MSVKKWCAKLTLALLVLILAASPALAAGPHAPAAPPKDPSQRLVIRAKNPANYDALKADVVKGGGKILVDRPEVNLMVVEAPDSAFKANLTNNPRAAAVASDHLTHLVRPAMQEEFLGKAVSRQPAADQGHASRRLQMLPPRELPPILPIRCRG